MSRWYDFYKDRMNDGYHTHVGQKYPSIVFKIGPLTFVRNWPDSISVMNIRYNTDGSRKTYFSTIAIGRRLLPGVYWLKEFRMEILKE